MVSIRQVLVTSAIIALSNAAPTEEKRGISSFTVQMVPKTNPSIKNGPAAYLKALTKYKASAEKISVVSAAAASSSVVATPAEYDEEYTCPVTIGKQTFTMDFDTGSSDLWVLGSKLASAGGSSHNYYTPGSSAKLLSGEKWSIEYGDGSSASGTVYSDTVTIGGTTVTAQDVEDATKASSTFTSSDEPSDGLVGLAFDSINTVTPTPAKTFFTNAIAQGLPKAVLCADLKHNAPGSYTFGAIPTTQYVGSITYTTISTSEGFWMFTPTGYAIGTAATVSPGASTMTGIADTGTTLLLVADSIVSAYYKKVSGAKNSEADGGYIFPCTATLPNFTLVVGGYKAVVPGSYMNYAPNGDGTCYGGLQSSDGIGFNIYGDIFLKSQFVVFDRTQSTPRIGFAAQ